MGFAVFEFGMLFIDGDGPGLAFFGDTLVTYFCGSLGFSSRFKGDWFLVYSPKESTDSDSFSWIGGFKSINFLFSSLI